jgi:hypothetical protein
MALLAGDHGALLGDRHRRDRGRVLHRLELVGQDLVAVGPDRHLALVAASDPHVVRDPRRVRIVGHVAGVGEPPPLGIGYGDRSVDELGDRLGEVGERPALQRHGGQPGVDGVRAPELHGLTVEDRAEHLGEDVVEHHARRQPEHGEREAVGGGADVGGQLVDIEAELDGQAGQAALRQRGHEVAQRVGVVADGVAGREQQLAPAHPPHDVGVLHHVHPVDPAVDAGRAREQLSALEARQRERLREGDGRWRGSHLVVSRVHDRLGANLAPCDKRDAVSSGRSGP